MNYAHRITRQMAGAALCTAAALAGGPISAQEFPSGPIEVVTHGSPGGGTDTTARMVIRGAEPILGVDMPVAMKLGAGGAVSLNYAADRGPGGETLMLLSSTHLLTMAAGSTPVDIDGLVGVARAADDPVIIVARPDGPYEDIEALTSAEDSVKWGTSNVGSLDHVAAASFGEATDTDVAIVPYDGGGAAVTAVIGGDVDVASPNAGESMDQIQRGDLLPLAVMAPERLDLLPDVPTMSELGYSGLDFSTTRGFAVLAGTPQEEIDILEEALLQAMQTPEYQSFLKNNAMPASSVAGAEVWDAQMREFHDKSKALLTELGMAR